MVGNAYICIELSEGTMTPEEYKQLRAYSRYDGIYLSVIWAAGFACFIGSLSYAQLNTLNMLLMISTPFFVAYRLRLFRKEARQDRITFLQALVYCLRVFFHASFIFAVLQWAYMQFLDNNLFVRFWESVSAMPEMQVVMEQAGVSMQEMTTAMQEITPLQFASTMMVETMILGVIMSLFIAVLMKKTQ